MSGEPREGVPRHGDEAHGRGHSRGPLPRVVHILQGDALEVTPTSFGTVGKIFEGERVEAVWISKQDEPIDRGWFSQGTVDLILVVQGQLKVEYERPDLPEEVLDPGDLLVLPAYTRCRAYRWPRDRVDAAVFVAFYPKG